MTRQQKVSSTWSRYWKPVLGEFLATALLMSLGCLTCLPLDGFHPNPPLYSPIGFGMIIILNVQIFAHISGSFMNPIVALVAVICGKISISLGIALSIAQCVGATAGYGILVLLSPKNLLSGDICVNVPHAELTAFQVVCVEMLFTGAISCMICSMWDPVNEKQTETNGMKFGFAVIGLGIASGPVGGVSMNPARSLGPAIWTGRWTGHWLYWIGPYMGAVLSTVFYKYVFMKSGKSVGSLPTMKALTHDVNGENCI